MDRKIKIGRSFIVTKPGKPKAQIVAVRKGPRTLIGIAKGNFKIDCDVGPVIDPGHWDEDREWRNYLRGFEAPAGKSRRPARRSRSTASRSPQ